MKKTSRHDPHGKLRKLSLKKLKELVKGCAITHSKSTKAEHIDLIEKCLDFNEKGTRFSPDDYSKVIRGVKFVFIDTEKAKKKADREGLARCTYGWSSRYDSWYITYSYIAGTYEYAFAWETYYDEIHRAYSGKSAWYDAIGQGSHFTIKYYSKDPKLHHVTAKGFSKLERPFFVGRKKVKTRKKKKA
jgi:hypothetical protein